VKILAEAKDEVGDRPFVCPKDYNPDMNINCRGNKMTVRIH